MKITTVEEYRAAMHEFVVLLGKPHKNYGEDKRLTELSRAIDKACRKTRGPKSPPRWRRYMIPVIAVTALGLFAIAIIIAAIVVGEPRP